MELGELISRYRKDAKLTIDELAAVSGVPKGTINKIINGNTKSPTLETMKALANALGKTLADFDDSALDGGSETKKAPVQDQDERSRIQAIFDQLSPANQTKLIELANLYLDAQNKNQETL